MGWNQASQEWTAQDDETLVEMWGDGKSGGMIAKALGRSRSSILGRVNRKGIQRKGMSDRQKRDMLAEHIANGAQIGNAAAYINVPKAEGQAIFRDICRDLGWQAR